MELEVELPERPQYRLVIEGSVPAEFTRSDLRRNERLRLVLPGCYGRTSGLYLIRCGSSASGPRVSLTQSAYSSQRALEPRHRRVALEREDVRRDPVEEPAVVRDHDGAAGEVEQRLLERAQRVDVEVVRRLVEQQQVAARAQELREVDAVALAAGEVADPLLLVGAPEVEPGDVLARVDLALAELDHVVAAGISCHTVFAGSRSSRAWST